MENVFRPNLCQYANYMALELFEKLNQNAPTQVEINIVENMLLQLLEQHMPACRVSLL